MTYLGVFGKGTTSRATGVSGDGYVVVGFSATNGVGANRSFLWIASGAIQDLGDLLCASIVSAHGISSDGSVVTGSSADGSSKAFRWTTGGGMENMGAPEMTPISNANGSDVVENNQFSIDKTLVNRAYLWTSTGMVDLGTIAGDMDSFSYSMNADGTMVVGTATLSGSNLATLWNQFVGMVDLNTCLPSQGIDLTGWVFDMYEASPRTARAI